MTEEENTILNLLGKAFTEFKKLEEFHPADLEEFVIGIHACQNIILAREGLRSLNGIELPIKD